MVCFLESHEVSASPSNHITTADNIVLSVAYTVNPFSMKWSEQLPTRMYVIIFYIFVVIYLHMHC
jgi:heme/copper-type cytochrome/quinol oxidase subunit 4